MKKAKPYHGFGSMGKRYDLPAIQVAADMTYAAFRAISAYIKPGINERQLAWRMGRLLAAEGSHKRAFPTIVAFGENAAEPHHIPTGRQLRYGDMIKIDAGAVFNHMRGDVTRTFYLAEPGKSADAKFVKRYQAVYTAQQKALPKFVVGAVGKDIDLTARNYLKSQRLHKLFVHSLGHGVGRAIHQPPWITPTRRGLQPLEVGHVVTNEPGVYEDGWGGIRIEDMVEITAGAPKVMGLAPAKLKEIVITS